MSIIDEVYKEKDCLYHEIEELEDIIENYEKEFQRMNLELKSLRNSVEESEKKLKDKDKMIECLNLLTGDLNLDLLEMGEKLEKVSSRGDMPVDYYMKYDDVAVDNSIGEHWIDIKNEIGKVVVRVNVDRILIQKPKFYQKIESNGQYNYRPDQGYAAMSCMPLEVKVENNNSGLKTEWAFTGFKADYINVINPGLNELGSLVYKPAYYFNSYFKVLTNSVVVGKGQANRILFKIEKDIIGKDEVWNFSGELVYDNSNKRFILFFIDCDVDELQLFKLPVVKSLKWGLQGEFFKLRNYLNLVVKRVRKIEDGMYELKLNLTVQKCNRFSSYQDVEDRVSIQTNLFNCDVKGNDKIKDIYFKEVDNDKPELWPGDDQENFFWNVSGMSYNSNKETIENGKGLLKYLVIEEKEEEYGNIFNVLMKKFNNYHSGRVYNTFHI